MKKEDEKMDRKTIPYYDADGNKIDVYLKFRFYPNKTLYLGLESEEGFCDDITTKDIPYINSKFGNTVFLNPLLDDYTKNILKQYGILGECNFKQKIGNVKIESYFVNFDKIQEYDPQGYKNYKIENNKIEGNENQNVLRKNYYEVEILNKWGENDIYVDFLIHDRILGKAAHCCNWYDGNEERTDIEIIEDIYNDGEKWFELPKTSELSDITYSIFEELCQTDSSMLWIDDEYSFELYHLNTEENLQILKFDIKKFHLESYIEFDGNDNITIYGGLQTLFDDNRENEEYKSDIKIHLVSKDYVLENFDLMNGKSNSQYDLIIFQDKERFFAIDDTICSCKTKVCNSLETAATWLLDGKLSVREYKKLNDFDYFKNYIIDETTNLKSEDLYEL